MAIKGIDIANKALDLLNEFDVSASQMTGDTFDSLVLTALNLVRGDIYDINPGWGYLRKIYELATVVDQATYDIETLQSGLTFDGIIKDKVRWKDTNDKSTDGAPLQFIESSRIQFLTEQGLQGDVTFFYKEQDTNGKELFALLPVPDKVKTIKIPYDIQLTADLDATTVLNNLLIPVRDQNMLIFGIAYYVALADERDVANRLFQHYQKAISSSTIDTFISDKKKDVQPRRHFQSVIKGLK